MYISQVNIITYIDSVGREKGLGYFVTCWMDIRVTSSKILVGTSKRQCFQTLQLTRKRII